MYTLYPHKFKTPGYRPWMSQQKHKRLFREWVEDGKPEKPPLSHK